VTTYMLMIPAPSGDGSLGPALFYMLGMFGILIYVVVTDPNRRKDPTPEEIKEKRKQEAFYQALMDSAKDRKKRSEKP
jgi:hypothetical protein